jgi:RNA polymerase sigma factor (sigma-70 family)
MSAGTITLNYVIPSLDRITTLSGTSENAGTDNHNKVLSNDEIISGLKSRDKQIINYIYKQSYIPVKYFVTTNNGSVMDAEDIFQDAMIIIYKNLFKQGFKLSCSFSTYIYSICRHLWLQKLAKPNMRHEIDENFISADLWDDNNSLQDHLNESAKYNLFKKHFNLLKKNEQKVLSLYLNKTPAREIANIMGFKSDKYAKFRKYLCKEKLKNMIVNDEQYRYIFEYQVNP